MSDILRLPKLHSDKSVTIYQGGNFEKKLWQIYHVMILERGVFGGFVIAKQICIRWKHVADLSFAK